MPDITKDFINLSRAVYEGRDEAIRYELVNIILNCIADINYKNNAEENIVAYATHEKKIKEQLNIIAESEDEDYKLIQPMAAELFLKIKTAPLATFINNYS